jgi:hypothetical protein
MGKNLNFIKSRFKKGGEKVEEKGIYFNRAPCRYSYHHDSRRHTLPCIQQGKGESKAICLPFQSQANRDGDNDVSTGLRWDVALWLGLEGRICLACLAGKYLHTTLVSTDIPLCQKSGYFRLPILQGLDWSLAGSSRLV